MKNINQWLKRCGRKTVGRMIVLRSFIAALSAAFFSLSGCADEPTSVGSQLLPASDFLKADSVTIFATSSSSVRVRPLEFVNRTRFAIGKNGTTESWGLLLFSVLPDSLKNASVQTAKLRLRANYHLGDSSALFSLFVRKALRSWTSVAFNFDSLKASGSYEAAGTQNDLGSVGDTDFVSLTVDTAVANSWLRNIGATVNTNHGIVLEPNTATVIKGFASTYAGNAIEHRPSLELSYTPAGSTLLDTAVIFATFDRFIAATSDTSFTGDSTTIFARNGLAYRGTLRFDVDSLPARAAILKATLEVTLNSASSSLNSYTRDSLFAVFMTTFGFPEDTPVFRFPSNVLSNVTTVNGQRVYRFLVTEFVQNWVRQYPVRSIALAGLSEANALDVFALHGSASTMAAFRPRIFVIYSSPQ